MIEMFDNERTRFDPNIVDHFILAIKAEIVQQKDIADDLSKPTYTDKFAYAMNIIE